MDTDTIRRLNDINRQFYAAVANDFDQTRADPWPGWARLLPQLQPPLAALDVGCGNGRFGLWLAAALSGGADLPPLPIAMGRGPGGGDNPPGVRILTYHGLDNSPALLERARAALAPLPNLTARLEERDIVENPPDSGDYDLVALFGLSHHIPGYAERQMLMRRLAERVKPGGLLVFTTWRFYEYERYRRRILPWPDDLAVEPGDYLLDWRRGTVSRRYCHYADDAEHAALAAATGLRPVLAYRADGDGGDANAYSLLKKE